MRLAGWLVVSLARSVHYQIVSVYNLLSGIVNRRDMNFYFIHVHTLAHYRNNVTAADSNININVTIARLCT